MFGQSNTQFKLSKELEVQYKRPLCKQLHQAFKKLVLVLAIFVPITKARQEDVVVLDWIFCICYLIKFKKSNVKIQALINAGIKVNTIIPRYILKLGLKIYSTNIRTWKIEDFTLKTFGIVIASF